MSRRLPALLTMLALMAAGAALAQEAAPAPDTTSDDPIGDMISTLPPDNSTDEAAAGEAQATAPESAPEPPPMVVRPYSPPPRPQLDRPVMIGEVGVSPDGPPTPLDLGYEARIRASFAAAQGLQGPMDGGWTVRGADGATLLVLQLVDRGTGDGLEGAWRDPLAGGLGKVGLIDSLERTPSSLLIRFTRLPGKPVTVLTLVPVAGGWAGEMSDGTGTRPVTVKRN